MVFVDTLDTQVETYSAEVFDRTGEIYSSLLHDYSVGNELKADNAGFVVSENGVFVSPGSDLARLHRQLPLPLPEPDRIATPGALDLSWIASVSDTLMQGISRTTVTVIERSYINLVHIWVEGLGLVYYTEWRDAGGTPMETVYYEYERIWD